MIGDRNSEGMIASEKDLQKIPSLARHLPQILMPLSGMINRYCAKAEVARNRRLLDFFEFVKSNYSDALYARIQLEHLSAESVRFLQTSSGASFEHKYLDFPFWAHSKFSVGTRLGLPKFAGESILDIGAGPAHFGVVSRYFGCAYEGLESVKLPRAPHTKEHLYTDLCDFFGIDRLIRSIRPFERIKFGRRFRLLTCLMGNFCSYDPVGPGARRKPWDWAEWVFLLDNLVTDAMAPTYTMYFHISRDYLSSDMAAKLRTFSTTFNESACVFTFDESLDIDRLRRSVG